MWGRACLYKYFFIQRFPQQFGHDHAKAMENACWEQKE